MIPFIVLLIFACLAATFYTGISWSGTAIKKSVYGFCDDRHMYDISVSSSIGFSDSDVALVRNIDGIDNVDAAYVTYGLFRCRDVALSAKVSSVTESVTLLSVTEGTLPQNTDEIAIEGKWAARNGIRPGDVLTVDGEGSELRESSFTVTALVETPAYFGTNTVLYESAAGTDTPLDTLLFVPAAAFRDTSVTGYRQVFLRSDSLRQTEFGSEKYCSDAELLKKRVVSVVGGIVSKRGEARIAPAAENASRETGGAGYADLLVMTAAESPSYVELQTILDMFGRFKYILSLPFVLISLMIACSVILRITNEGASHIGLQLAMGFSPRGVTSIYLLFSVVPTLIGSALGALLGCAVVEPVFVGAVSELWAFEERVSVFVPWEAVCIVAVITVLMNVAAAASCRLLMKRDTLSLIKGAGIPAVKSAFYEKTRFWKKLPLLVKSIVNNIRTDHIRVTVTLLGIIGCTALSISGLYMLRSIDGGFTRQFEEIQNYETIVFFDPQSNAETSLVAKLRDREVDSLPVYTSSVYLNAPDGETVPASVLVADNGFDGFLTFHSPDGEKLLPGKRALLSRPYANYYHVAADATQTVTAIDGSGYEVPIGGVFDFYLTRQQLVFRTDRYEELTGQTVRHNALLVAKTDLSVSDLDALLREVDGYICTHDHKTVMYTSYSLYLRISAAISGLLIVLSLSMALFMLLNLFMQFVTEKKREIITMIINGYSLRRVKRYIYFDTVFLGTVGIAVGAVLGNLLGALDVRALFSAFSYFPQRVDYVACLGGMGISAAFITFMCLRALGQIKKFDISDLNKA